MFLHIVRSFYRPLTPPAGERLAASVGLRSQFDRDRLDDEADGMSDRIEDGFHPRSNQPVTGATRTMQRKPKWHVEVSIGCGMRADGR